MYYSIVQKIVNSFGIEFPDIFNFSREGTKATCNQLVDKSLLNKSARRRRQKMSRERAEARLSLEKWGDVMEITDVALLALAKKLSNRNSYINVQDEEGRHYFVEANVKGSRKRYRLAHDKIMLYSGIFAESGWETVALTLTCDPKNYFGSRMLAWEYYGQEISKIMKDMQKHKGAVILGVAESTKKGFPHAHLLVALPKGTIAGFSKMKKRQKIKYGDFYDYVKRWVVSPVFNLEVVKGKQVEKYLAKYLTKGMYTKIENITICDGNMKKEDRKFLLEYGYSVTCGTRTIYTPQARTLIKKFGITDAETIEKIRALQRKKVVYDMPKVEEPDYGFDVQEHARIIMDDSAPLEKRCESAGLVRQALIKYCAIFPCPFDKKVMMYQKNYVNAHFGADLRAMGKHFELIRVELEPKGVLMSCSGCLEKEVSFLIHGKPSKFDDFVYQNRDMGWEKLFGKNELAHDLVWMHTFIQLMLYIHKETFLHGRAWYDIIEDRHIKFDENPVFEVKEKVIA